MKLSRLQAAVMAASTVLLMAGCASKPPPKESGFLKNYSELKKEDAPGGGTRLVYRNPQFTPANYNAIMLDPVVFYPEPQATEQVSMATLDDIRNYINASMRQKLGQQVRLADKPGPGVAQVTVAITAVGSETQSLKAYQYIPIAFVVTAAMAGVEGGRPKDASIAIETRITDSVSGQLLYAAVRGGTGQKIESASQGQGGIQAANLKPLIDEWTTGAASEVGKFVVSK
jgi:hypothetical protein